MLVMVSLVLVSGLLTTALAEQKIAFVNSDRILAEYKEAQEAQSKLDVEAKNFRKNTKG